MIPLSFYLYVAVGISVCMLVTGQRLPAQETPQHSPSAASASPKPDEPWARIELYRDGQKAYTEKKFLDAFEHLVAFRAVNQAVFASPPKHLERVVTETNAAIAFCESQLADNRDRSAKASSASTSAAKKDTADRRKGADGIWRDGNPRVYDKSGGNRDGGGGSKSVREGSSKGDSGGGKNSSGSSVREGGRP